MYNKMGLVKLYKYRIFRIDKKTEYLLVKEQVQNFLLQTPLFLILLK